MVFSCYRIISHLVKSSRILPFSSFLHDAQNRINESANGTALDGWMVNATANQTVAVEVE